MQKDDYLKWLQEVAQRIASVGKLPSNYYGSRAWSYQREQTLDWVADANSAIAWGFPENSPTRQMWGQFLYKVDPIEDHGGSLENLFSIFRSAVKLVENGRLISLIETIRAETVSDLLEQADALISAGHVVAAAVIAGGALETQLRHYAETHGITVEGPGSLSKYNNAVSQLRKSNPTSVYSASDGKLIDSWGGIRNEAAHTPTTFAVAKEDVERMVDGIRGFVSRTS